MQIEAHFDIETIERLGKQSKLLLRMYQAEFAKDPAVDVAVLIELV